MRSIAPIPLLKHRARRLARRDAIPLHAALDRIAQGEGFARWSLLAERSISPSRLPSALPVPAGTSLPPLLPRWTEGDLVLVGARPGQGKTLLGLRLLLEAAGAGRRAVFFTLEYTQAETRARLVMLAGGDGTAVGGIEIVASDDISAELIAAHIADAPRGTVAVVDYLQILDQDRRKPALGEQVEALRDLARIRGLVLAVLAQIDRRFDPGLAGPPDVGDLRLPNPVAIEAFTQTCFLHAGQMRFGSLG